MLSFWNKATVFIHFMTANLGVPATLFIHGGNVKEEIAKSNYLARRFWFSLVFPATPSCLLKSFELLRLLSFYD